MISDAFDRFSKCSPAVCGAMHLARLYLHEIGTALSDEQVRQVASRTLCGFALAGGLEIEVLKELRAAALDLDAHEDLGAPGLAGSPI